MKKIVGLGLCISLLLASSCNQQTVVPDTEETSSIVDTTVQSSTSVSTTATTTTELTYEEYIPEYDVDQTYLNVTFNDIYNLCEELSGVDLDDWVLSEPDLVIHRVETDEYEISYIPDYSAYLDYMTEPDDQGYVYVYPTEAEYHIKRAITINGFLFAEFEDDYWAEVNYSMHMDRAFDYDSFMDESDYLNGYAFLYDESDMYSTIYYACYVTDRCFMKYTYWFNSPDIDYYQSYLEVCEGLGLPTCSEMTDEIVT